MTKNEQKDLLQTDMRQAWWHKMKKNIFYELTWSRPDDKKMSKRAFEDWLVAGQMTKKWAKELLQTDLWQAGYKKKWIVWKSCANSHEAGVMQNKFDRPRGIKIVFCCHQPEGFLLCAQVQGAPSPLLPPPPNKGRGRSQIFLKLTRVCSQIYSELLRSRSQIYSELLRSRSQIY